MSARIGGILCPYLNMLGEYWRPLPLIVYGVFAFSGLNFNNKFYDSLSKKARPFHDIKYLSGCSEII